MSKPVKELIVADYKKRFEEIEDALLIDIRGVNANDNNKMRISLREKDIRITIVKNTLAKMAFTGSSLEPLSPAMVGPSALAFGGNSVVEVARELVEWAKKTAHMELKAAVLDGEFFEGEAGVKRLSEFPTKEEAHGRIIQIALSPVSNVVGAALASGSKILGIIKEIQERLEDGKAISKAG